jgi:hypothetical protein
MRATGYDQNIAGKLRNDDNLMTMKNVRRPRLILFRKLSLAVTTLS